MQHTTIAAVAAVAPVSVSDRQDWWVFAEGVKLFAASRADDAFLAFAEAARGRVADYALGVRLERAAAGRKQGLRAVGYWEESAFLRRVVIERELGEIDAEQADELLGEVNATAAMHARVVGLEFDAAGAPVNLIVDILASR